MPALENLSMYPSEERCRACLRKGCSNWSDKKCWEENYQGACCGRFVWGRKTPSSKKTNRKKEECREDGGG